MYHQSLNNSPCVEVSFLPLTSGKTITQALQEMIPDLSKQVIKKWAPSKKFENTIIDQNHSYSIPLNILNFNEFNPHYEGAKIEVVFEDDLFFAISIPSMVHSSSICYYEKNTVFNWLRSHDYYKVLNVNTLSRNRGQLNRLDFYTSGLIIFAKNSQLYQQIRNNYSAYMIKKKYYCVVQGKLEGSKHLVHYLSSCGIKAKMMKVSDNQGQLAELTYTAIKYNSKNDSTLVKINLHTGLRHQIRVQMATIGYPLVGDNLYNLYNKVEPRSFFLHAHEYQLQYNEKIYIFKATPPDEIEDIFEK